MDAIAIHLANIGKNILNLHFPSDLPVNDQGQQTFYSLGNAPALLIYDNVIDFKRIQPWLPPTGMPCHVLITTLEDVHTLTWTTIEVEPLSHHQSIELVEKLAGVEFAKRYGGAIADHAGGLPVQIVPEVTTLAFEQRRGRVASPGSGFARPAEESFRTAYQRLEKPARLVLHAASILTPQRIPSDELSGHLIEGIGWTAGDYERALDACLDLHLLERTTELSMHQLFTTYLRKLTPSTRDETDLKQIREAQRKRFVVLAAMVDENPADSVNAGALISYPLIPSRWMDLGQLFAIAEYASIGHSLFQLGQFEEARPWFESAAEKKKGDADGKIDHESLGRSLHLVGDCLTGVRKHQDAQRWFEQAVTEKKQGDLNGRIDHESLGRSLHQVGYCLSNTGSYEDARQWYERALAEKQKGDLEGRIDPESLSSSLHQIGSCLSSTEKFEEARQWYERAVAESEKGDVRGRIDHESLSNSLHRVGHCLSSDGRYEEARPWYERAVVEAQKGDVYGRVDHDSLGRSMHQVGSCLSSLGRDDEARAWYERAIAEKEKGDVYGRVNQESLAASLSKGAACLRKIGDVDTAGQWDRRAEEIKRAHSL